MCIRDRANTRVCLVRTGLVLSPKGGAFAKILPLYRFGLGGKLGNGEQYWSWITLEDMVKGLLFLLDHNACEGAFNFTAPHPVKNKTFNQLLGQASVSYTHLDVYKRQAFNRLCYGIRTWF